MALKWLGGGGKPDHPLADDKSAKEVLSALPANDPAKAIQEIRDLIAGKRPVRDADDTPHAPRGSAVPSAGKGRKRGEPDAGLEPQPQPQG